MLRGHRGTDGQGEGGGGGVLVKAGTVGFPPWANFGQFTAQPRALKTREAAAPINSASHLRQKELLIAYLFSKPGCF